MKSLIRWSATLGLVGSTLLTSWLGHLPKALALPEADVLKVLQIPVFTITTADGGPLIATLADNQKVTQVFMSQQDADTFLGKLKEAQPDLAKQVKVQPVSLGQVYQLAIASSKEAEQLKFAYIPMQSAVDSAKTVLSESGQEYKGGVPLFILRGGPEQAMLTIQQNNQEVIPFFFEKAQIQAIADQLKKDQPDLAATMKIEVIPLENLIAALHQKDDAMLKQIQLIPSQETIKFIQQSMQSQQGQSQPTTPKK
ncbi:Tic22 family protein [Crocosphaera sp. UHCC 0190]|uniref:Tic22 family protein n=1 Tax=Crocosphaera sp. UHCC 0190 TaxID=3110246 RepID=UPI002B205685|nr:Tic22 family protein [Crocosphaera sp. UHCC 0190]MEA5510070.1 Tic22 family protein [Crocosphaera sp. UHCC 0190]